MAPRQKSPKLHTRSMVTVPFPVLEATRVVRAAKRAGQSVSGFIREAAIQRANDILDSDPTSSAAEPAA